MALIRLTSEASTPFINLRWFLLSFNMKLSKYFIYNWIAVIIIFSIFRILPILPLWYLFRIITLTQEWNNVKFWQKILCVGSSIPLDILNIYWYYLILKNSYKLLRTNRLNYEKIIENKDN